MANLPTIPVPLQARSDKRTSERYIASMPVHVGGELAATQDLSQHGLSFVTQRRYEPGERLQLTIEYLLDGHNYPLECEAEVMRVQEGPNGFTIGARLTAPSGLLDNPVPEPELKPEPELGPGSRPNLRPTD